MSIITKPSSIQKNVPAEFTLNKLELSQLPSVLADSYFSDLTNWKEVLIYYKSATGSQNEVVKFDATLVSPIAEFLISDKARDVFQVQRICIIDFDNGNIKIRRSELNVESFDINISSVKTENVIFVDPINLDTYNISGNSVSKASGPTVSGGVYHSSIRSQQSFKGDGYVEWTNNNYTPQYYMISLSKDPRGNSYSNQEYAINKFPSGYEVYVNGSLKIHISSSAQNVKIEKIGTNVNFYLDNILSYTEIIASDNINSYYLECSFYDIGNGINNAKINGNL